MNPADLRKEKGLPLNVKRVRNANLNGITSRYDRVTLIGILDESRMTVAQMSGAPFSFAPLPLHWRSHAPSADRPPVVLVKRNVFGSVDWSIRPLLEGEDGRWFMNGGNYVENNTYLNELTGGVRDDLPVHDRYEPAGS